MTRIKATTRLLSVVAVLAIVALGGSALAERTFRIALTASPPEKGNAVAGGGVTANFIWHAFFDPLIRIGNDGSMVPALATGWKPVSDTEWHFSLRQGVKFANGEPFNADAVKFTFDMLRRDEATRFMRGRDMRYYPRSEVIDEFTVAIHTVEPNAAAPRYLSPMKIGPPAYMREVGFAGMADQPIGTGPFVVERWGADRITARANPHAYLTPQVDRLEILIVPDSTARVQALLTDQVDVAMAISTDQMSQIEEAGHRTAARTPHRVYVAALQAEDPASPFSNTAVRQAVNYAVNKHAITEVLLAGLVEPASQPALPLTDGFNDDLEPYPYDPDKAKQLLSGAGYDDGFTFSLETVSGFMPNDTAILQQIQSDLAAVGVTMEINVITYPTLVRATLFGELSGQAMTTDFFNTTGDALRSFIGTLNHACTGPKPWYCDETIQPVIDEARVAMDPARRASLTQRVVRYYRDDAAALLLFPVLGLDGIHRRVTAWEPWLDVLNYHAVDVAD